MLKLFNYELDCSRKEKNDHESDSEMTRAPISVSTDQMASNQSQDGGAVHNQSTQFSPWGHDFHLAELMCEWGPYINLLAGKTTTEL